MIKEVTPTHDKQLQNGDNNQQKTSSTQELFGGGQTKSGGQVVFHPLYVVCRRTALDS